MENDAKLDSPTRSNCLQCRCHFESRVCHCLLNLSSPIRFIRRYIVSGQYSVTCYRTILHWLSFNNIFFSNYFYLNQYDECDSILECFSCRTVLLNEKCIELVYWWVLWPLLVFVSLVTVAWAFPKPRVLWYTSHL